MTDKDALTGQLIGQKYRVVRKLGEGGMGAVYEAIQEGLGRRVAVKVLLPAYAENPEIVARFQREAQSAASLGHANIIAVTDFGAGPEGVFLVMELLEGGSLAHELDCNGPLSPERAAWIASQVLAALRAAHHAGIVHRDIKPDNVFLTQVSGVYDVVKVLDFGIARFTESGAHAKLTSTGAVLGTPAYMSPEQARGRAVDARTDVYSVGVMLYEMLTGQLPFRATNYHALLFAILEETPEPLASLRADLPQGFAAVIERAMARDLSVRFDTADSLMKALEPFVVRSVSATTLSSAPRGDIALAHTMAATGLLVTPAPRSTPPNDPFGPRAVSPTVTAAPPGSAPTTATTTPRKWLPWAAAGVLSLAGVALGFGLRGGSRSLEVTTTGDVAGTRSLHVTSTYTPAVSQDASAPVAQTLDVPEPPMAPAETPTQVAQTNHESPSAPPQNASPTAPEEPPEVTDVRARTSAALARIARTARSRVGSDDRPESGLGTLRARGAAGLGAVRTTYSGGRFPNRTGTDARANLQPALPALSRCASQVRPGDGEGNEQGWGMDFELSLNGQGAVETVTPRGDTTRARPALVACVRRVFSGMQMVDPGATNEIEFHLFNRYLTPRR
ncbi:MAG: protein kinase [Deltaproteobacteria bacterium]|nr:protein kinase [Deltaproteobacteria bacterium]